MNEETEETALCEASRLVYHYRNDDYGSVEDVYSTVSALWHAYLTTTEAPLTSHDVCVMMALLKIGRETHKHKRDNIVDAMGYLQLLDDLFDRK